MENTPIQSCVKRHKVVPYDAGAINSFIVFPIHFKVIAVGAEFAVVCGDLAPRPESRYKNKLQKTKLVRVVSNADKQTIRASVYNETSQK